MSLSAGWDMIVIWWSCSSDADVKWAHDKFEELLKMDEQEGSMKVDENNHEEMELVKMEV